MATVTIDASSEQQNIITNQGADFTLNMTVKAIDQSPFDLTGFDARLQIRKAYTGAATINATLMNSILVLTNAAGGILTLNLPGTLTSPITFPNATDDSIDMLYDLFITSPAGISYRPVYGTWTMLRQITK